THPSPPTAEDSSSRAPDRVPAPTTGASAQLVPYRRRCDGMARPPDDRTSRHPAFGPVSPTRGTPRRRRRSARRPVLGVVVTLGVLWFALGRPTTPADLDLPGGADDGSVAVSTGSPTADLVSPPADAEGPFPVVRVVDGDTVIVARPEGETR